MVATSRPPIIVIAIGSQNTRRLHAGRDVRAHHQHHVAMVTAKG
jgi:hypothetical protein